MVDQLTLQKTVQKAIQKTGPTLQIWFLGGALVNLDVAPKIVAAVFSTEELNVSKVTKKSARLWTSNCVHFLRRKLTKYAIIIRAVLFGRLDNGVTVQPAAAKEK